MICDIFCVLYNTLYSKMRNRHVPHYLEPLTQASQLLISSSDGLTFNHPTQYTVCNLNDFVDPDSFHEKIFSATLISTHLDCCQSGAVYGAAGFSMKIENNVGDEVIYLKRESCRCEPPYGRALLWSSLSCCLLPFWCCNLCGDSCLSSMEVHIA